MQYRNGRFYYKPTNSTYIMKNGTCIAVYDGYVPATCSHGFKSYPIITNVCPVSADYRYYGTK